MPTLESPSKLRMTPAFEASLVLNSLSLVAGASLLICLVRMRFCCENPLSQLAVWRGSVRAICVSFDEVMKFLFVMFCQELPQSLHRYDFIYCVGVSKYAIVGKDVGFCDVRILVCFDCVGTNRYCHWRLEQCC